jgi:hypothetical protein
MRSPIDVLSGRVGGFTTTEVARRTVPCYKQVIKKHEKSLNLYILVDQCKHDSFLYECVKPRKGLEIKARFLRGEMEHLRLREFQPGLCRYVERAEKAV